MVLLVSFSQVDLILNEEFTTDDKEQNDCGQDITDRGIDAEIRRDLPRARIKKGYEEGGQYHNQRIELREPRNENKE